MIAPGQPVDPLLVLTGDQYATMAFATLHQNRCEARRSDRVPVVARILNGEGTLLIYANGNAREISRG